MTRQIEVRSVGVLEELHGALKRFAIEAQEPLQMAALEINRTLQWLSDRSGYWRARVQFYTMEVDRAQRAYDACRQSDARDPRTGQYHQPDCWSQYKALEEARAFLREATAELAKAERALREVQDAAQTYLIQARRLDALLNGDVPRGHASLGRSIDRLRSFLGMGMQYGGTSGSVPVTLPPAPAAGTELHGPESAAGMDGDVVRVQAQTTLWTEYAFHDANSHNLLLLAHRVGDECYIRVHDLDLTPEVRRDGTSVANGGYANVWLERDQNGQVTRARLQDILVTPSHRLSGIGSQLLEEAERFASAQYAQELYGEAPDSAETREWYMRRGYTFRASEQNGDDVTKALTHT